MNNRNKLRVGNAIYLFVQIVYFIRGLFRFSAEFGDINAERCDLALAPRPEFFVAYSRSRHTVFHNMMRYTVGTLGSSIGLGMTGQGPL